MHIPDHAHITFMHPKAHQLRHTHLGCCSFNFSTVLSCFIRMHAWCGPWIAGLPQGIKQVQPLQQLAEGAASDSQRQQRLTQVLTARLFMHMHILLVTAVRS